MIFILAQPIVSLINKLHSAILFFKSKPLHFRLVVKDFINIKLVLL
jgi:hypothetical protein